MDKYEYVVRYYNANTADKLFSTWLNEFGERGWELVSTIPSSVIHYECVFKRKKK